MKIDYLSIEKETERYEWKNIIVTDTRDQKISKKTTFNKGRFFKVPRIKTIFRLSWNGSRFAKSIEFDKFSKAHPDMIEKLNKYLKENYK
jgi:hypothetical protein